MATAYWPTADDQLSVTSWLTELRWPKASLPIAWSLLCQQHSIIININSYWKSFHRVTIHHLQLDNFIQYTLFALFCPFRLLGTLSAAELAKLFTRLALGSMYTNTIHQIAMNLIELLQPSECRWDDPRVNRIYRWIRYWMGDAISNNLSLNRVNSTSSAFSCIIWWKHGDSADIADDNTRSNKQATRQNTTKNSIKICSKQKEREQKKAAGKLMSTKRNALLGCGEWWQW